MAENYYGQNSSSAGPGISGQYGFFPGPSGQHQPTTADYLPGGTQGQTFLEMLGEDYDFPTVHDQQHPPGPSSGIPPPSSGIPQQGYFLPKDPVGWSSSSQQFPAYSSQGPSVYDPASQPQPVQSGAPLPRTVHTRLINPILVAHNQGSSQQARPQPPPIMSQGQQQPLQRQYSSGTVRVTAHNPQPAPPTQQMQYSSEFTHQFSTPAGAQSTQGGVPYPSNAQHYSPQAGYQYPSETQQFSTQASRQHHNAHQFPTQSEAGGQYHNTQQFAAQAGGQYSDRHTQPVQQSRIHVQEPAQWGASQSTQTQQQFIPPGTNASRSSRAPPSSVPRGYVPGAHGAPPPAPKAAPRAPRRAPSSRVPAPVSQAAPAHPPAPHQVPPPVAPAKPQLKPLPRREGTTLAASAAPLPRTTKPRSSAVSSRTKTSVRHTTTTTKSYRAEDFQGTPDSGVPTAENFTFVPPRESANEQQGFVPPLDLGPHATRDDILQLWDLLSEEDRQILLESATETAADPDVMDGSPGDSDARETGAPSTGEAQGTAPTAPTPSDPAASTHQPRRMAFVSDATDSEDDTPTRTIGKGKGRADRPAPPQTNSNGFKPPSGDAPANHKPAPPRSTTPRRTSGVLPHFGNAVLNAVNDMGRRMDRIEHHVSQGFQQVEKQISELKKAPAPPPKAGSSSSKRRQARSALSVASRVLSGGHHSEETEDFTAQLGTITSDTEEPPPSQPTTSARPPSGASQPHAGVLPSYPPPTTAWQPPPFQQHVPVYTPNAGRPMGASLPGPAPYPPYAVPSPSKPVPPSFQPSSSPEKPDKVDPKIIKALQKYVRVHLWDKLLKIRKSEELPERCQPLTAEDHKKFVALRHSYITRENFRIDFTRSWKKDPFNLEARAFVVQDFLSLAKGGEYCKNPVIPSYYLVEDIVEAALDSHMDYAYSEYRKHTAPKDEKTLAKQEAVKIRKQVGARQGTLLRWRKEILDILGLDRHLVLFGTDVNPVHPVHMSGDEASMPGDGRNTRVRLYYIIEAEWQSEDFKDFLHKLDKWYIYYWRQRGGNTAPGGNPPRIRITRSTNPKKVDSPAPNGLYRNCYDDAWLAKKTPYELQKMRIIDEVYDFSLPDPPPIPEDAWL